MDVSMEALSIHNMRPDIQEASRAPAEIKAKLVYMDYDELDTGMQKVQPLPFLDEEIQKHYDVIRESLGGAKQVNDPVPGRVFEIVENVIKTAKEGKTTLFKASELLEITSEEFLYARNASLDDFDLRRRSQEQVSDYSRVFERMIRHRIEALMNEAAADMEECQVTLDKAVQCADQDRGILKDRMAKEDADISMDTLKETLKHTQEAILGEKGELEMIREQCDTDISTIASELNIFGHKMDTAARDYEAFEKQHKVELSKNCNRQRELEAELARLKTQEQKLEEDLTSGVMLQKEASKAREKALTDISEWNEKIVELQKRTQIALSIMTQMEECTNVILKDAMAKKDHWSKRLNQLEKENLLSLRNSLMCQGALFMKISAESKENQAQVTKELQQMAKDKEGNARRGYAKKVNKLNLEIEESNEQKQQFEDEIDKMQKLLGHVRVRVGEVDARLKQLPPVVKLDTVEERYGQLKLACNQAFDKRSTTGIQFSKEKYN